MVMEIGMKYVLNASDEHLCSNGVWELIWQINPIEMFKHKPKRGGVIEKK